MHYNCLIIDDETDLAKMTCEYFQAFDVTCAWLDTPAKYFSFIKENTADLLLLDINLQEESGFSLCKKIREQSDIPILFISARQSDDDVLIALNIGGDDYIKKPYTLSVLLAKVKVMLKRMKSGQSQTECVGSAGLSCGNFRLEEETLKAFVKGREVVLKAKEFKLLKCLFEHRNTIVSKETLFDVVWGDTYFSDGTLNVHIRKLREKLEDNPNEPEMIKTIWGTGYMLEIEDED
ncbi:MAG: response regulator transcription factor [Lachnospiraceae bacterium]|nr:response regulator transcription factor [Lachnospiraceae bacterium]